MVEALLNIIDRLLQWGSYRMERFQRQFELIVAPTFEEMEAIHRDYLAMFSEVSGQLRSRPDSLGDLIGTLETRRLLFEPVRFKIIHSLPQLREASLAEEINAFVAAVIMYFPIGDLPGLQGGTSATFLLSELMALEDCRRSGLSFADKHPRYIVNEAIVPWNWDPLRPWDYRPFMDWQDHFPFRPWGNDPVQCVEFFISLLRGRWALVCSAEARARVRLATMG